MKYASGGIGARQRPGTAGTHQTTRRATLEQAVPGNIVCFKGYYAAAFRAFFMKWLRLLRNQSTYVDTPQGIYTDALIWFRTREAWLNSYAGPVFEHRTLNQLLAEAAVWLRSPQTLTLCLLPALLLTFRPMQAALASLVIFAGWQALSPALVSRSLIPIFRVAELVFLQALYYITTMSLLAAGDKFSALVIGLAGFIVLRWGLLRMVLRPVAKLIWGSLYRMPVPDHVLRAIIIRAALRYRVTLADFAPIEENVVRHLKRK